MLITVLLIVFFFFFFNDTATTEIYTLSLHDALPICRRARLRIWYRKVWGFESPLSHHKNRGRRSAVRGQRTTGGTEEHTSVLQSQSKIVCRLFLLKKKHN